jgi:hypothetical protein
MHAPAFFQRSDEAIDCARAERIAADEQRVKTESSAQALVAEVARNEPVDAAKPMRRISSLMRMKRSNPSTSF